MQTSKSFIAKNYKSRFMFEIGPRLGCFFILIWTIISLICYRGCMDCVGYRHMWLLPLVSISTTLSASMQCRTWWVEAAVLYPLNTGPLPFALLVKMSWCFLKPKLMHALGRRSWEWLRHAVLGSGVAAGWELGFYVSSISQRTVHDFAFLGWPNIHSLPRSASRGGWSGNWGATQLRRLSTAFGSLACFCWGGLALDLLLLLGSQEACAGLLHPHASALELGEFDKWVWKGFEMGLFWWSLYCFINLPILATSLGGSLVGASI